MFRIANTHTKIKADFKFNIFKYFFLFSNILFLIL
jgi:hypothetical protein